MGKYYCTIDLLFDWFGLVCFANKNKNCQLSYSKFQNSQTGGQWNSDTSPFSIPCRSNLGCLPLSVTFTNIIQDPTIRVSPMRVSTQVGCCLYYKHQTKVDMTKCSRLLWCRIYYGCIRFYNTGHIVLSIQREETIRSQQGPILIISLWRQSKTKKS